ncbi:MAG: hypothetical protein M3N54_01055 [Acidobacteriota bacterium]|nr:hypothetical protein [Acidobacteriota bacterium]
MNRRSFVLSWIPWFHRKPGTMLSGVEFRVLKYGHSPRRFLVVHGDEDTARDVLSGYMNDHAGVAYIVTGKERNVTIQGLRIDPNRMFSRVGAERSIVAQNHPGIDPAKVNALLDFLDRERPRALKHLVPPKGSRLFALHNNRNYSVEDEIAASDQTSIKQPQLPRHFFLCTSPADYEILRQSPYNVVLQTRPEPDDGSLSRLAARRGFRYINLECAIGDYEAQLQRVRWLEDRLP